MSKSFRKLISLVLIATLSMSFLLVGMTVFGEDLVAVNSVNFPDDNFRMIISEQYDLDGNGYLDSDEMSGENVENFYLTGIIDDEYEGMEIASIKGVELFGNIDTLYCSGIGLEELDVSAMPNLRYLYCGGNEFKVLSLVNNTNLISLKCGGGELEELILPNTSSLRVLHCYGNKLESLDVSKLTGLTELSCHSNELTSLDTLNNGNLTMLICSNNHITSLDLSNNPLDANVVTSAMIANQNVIVFPVQEEENSFIIPFENRGLTLSNYILSDLQEYNDSSGFDGSVFFTNDKDAIREGIEYFCRTNNDVLPELQVHITTAYKVDFYYDDEFMDYIGYAMTFPGETAVPPELEWTPMCKAVDYWSESIENVQSDMEVYAIWKDDHHPEIQYLADDNDTIHIDCPTCNNIGYDVSFISVVNTKTGDDAYDELVDVNNDGYINAKDYAVIYRDYKLQPELPEEDEEEGETEQPSEPTE